MAERNTITPGNRKKFGFVLRKAIIMKAIDVYILTGYLGAGKTTTLNRLIGAERFAGKKLALIINEFGKMGVDGQLLLPGDYTKYEINKGSIFCICTKTDFLKALDSI